MLVKWKILCSFGLIFWASMCVMDYRFGNIINKGEFSKIEDTALDEEGEDLGYLTWKQVATWGMFSFIASFFMCISMKICKQIIYKLTQNSIAVTGDNQQPNSAIALIEPAKPSGISMKFEPAIPEKDNCSFMPNLNLLEAVKDFPVTIESSTTELTSRLVEKRCSKLKEEMREMQMNTWKEYSNLNKKLDTLTKEKSDLGRQLIQFQKDNKQLKQQLDDIISDRALLIKRLEVATKEIKLNTSAKQMTLDKLEEAVDCNTQMKARVKQLGEEKKDLEGRYKDLEAKYGSLMEQVRNNLEKRGSPLVKSTDNNSDLELEQSEKDIEKVQNKLLDLEKSLEKMRSSRPSTAISENDENNNFSSGDAACENRTDSKQPESSDDENLDKGEKQNFSNENANGAQFEDSTPRSPLLQMDQNMEESTDSDDHNQESVNAITLDILDDQQETETETSNNCQTNEARTISTSNSDVSTSSTSRSEEISVEDSETDMVYPPGIVSQSPAFQRFLLKVLESPVV